MSHMTQVKTKYRDLDALAEAAEARGMEFRRDQLRHHWYGRFVGDSTPPKGRDPADYGKCEHAIRLKDHQPGDYEIGVVRALDGDGYELMFDTWGSGQKLVRAGGGAELHGLKREYSAAVATKKAKAALARKGFTVERETLGNTIRLRLRKR